MAPFGYDPNVSDEENYLCWCEFFRHPSSSYEEWLKEKEWVVGLLVVDEAEQILRDT